MFLVISDDLLWCTFMLKPLSNFVVIIPYMGAPLEDMALITVGNHSIMSLGTFGMWGGMLAEGEILYPGNKISYDSYWLQEGFNKINDTALVKIYWR